MDLGRKSKHYFSNLQKNYYSFCTILSIFSVGHFNFTCSKDVIFDYTNLDVCFKFKDWELSIKSDTILDNKIIIFEMNKDTRYRIITILLVNQDDNDDIYNTVKDNIDYDEILILTPFEKDKYDENEICVDISNVESFRRIQQFVLRAMIYSDNERNECPFCQYHLDRVESDNVSRYLCEGCKTLIVDTLCKKTGKKYSYTDIDGYDKEELNINKFKYEKWLYYRKKEAILHYRNITKLDEDNLVICPHCHKPH